MTNGAPGPQVYQGRLVAFVDILGFTDLVVASADTC